MVLTLVAFVSETVVSMPLASCTTKVSASRRVTTPLTFIFWPEATVRVLAPPVCAKVAGARESTSAKVSAMNLTLFETLLIFILLRSCESLSGNFARRRP